MSLPYYFTPFHVNTFSIVPDNSLFSNVSIDRSYTTTREDGTIHSLTVLVPLDDSLPISHGNTRKFVMKI